MLAEQCIWFCVELLVVDGSLSTKIKSVSEVFAQFRLIFRNFSGISDFSFAINVNWYMRPNRKNKYSLELN